jgi:cob(I)alamin adenosyltransferase
VRLYTKTGDDGTTGLFSGTRVSKCCPRVEAYGEVDELNAVLGWCASADPSCREALHQVQHALFIVGAELATPPNSSASTTVELPEATIAALENWIDSATAATPALTQFILPGGSEVGARLHMARTICRRAERAVVELATQDNVRPVLIRYLNRLSDLLFAWARLENHEQQAAEIPWDRGHTQS